MRLSLQICLVLLSVFTGRGDQNSEKLLDLAGFSSFQSRNLELKGFGTGFAVSPDGYLISASHVTEGCDAVRVIFKNGQSLDAKVVKEEPKLDLVLLKVDVRTPSFLKVASRTSGLGDDIYTIGYPSPELLGANQKFTKGSISALSGLQDDSFRYQISIPIQPGNSGGPVVCEETGEVVGIIVSSLKGKEVVGFNPQSVNYALKSAFIKPILDSLEVRQNLLSKTSSNKNERRRKVVDSTCMVVTCKFIRNEESLQTSENKAPNDVIAPILQVIGYNPITIKLGETYSEPGVVSDGGEEVFVSGTVDTMTSGSYKLKYWAKDKAGNVGTAERTVIVHKLTSADRRELIVKQKAIKGILGILNPIISIGESVAGKNAHKIYIDNKLLGEMPINTTKSFYFIGAGLVNVKIIFSPGQGINPIKVYEENVDFSRWKTWQVNLN